MLVMVSAAEVATEIVTAQVCADIAYCSTNVLDMVYSSVSSVALCNLKFCLVMFHVSNGYVYMVHGMVVG